MVITRIQPLNKQNIASGSYVLLLIRYVRSRSSPSFSFASQQANKLKVPVLVSYIYHPDRHNLAQKKFLMEGLGCLENAFSNLSTPFFVAKADDSQEAIEIILKLCENACEVITDAAYLREDRIFEENLKEILVTKLRRLTRVEGNVLVPVMALCPRPAYNANSIRKVIWHLLDSLLLEKWECIPKYHCKAWKSIVKCNVVSMDISLETMKLTNECKTKSCLIGGEIAAQQVLDKFIAGKLNTYDKFRNIPNGDSQSCLSAYIHFGMLNPMDIVMQVQQSEAPKEAKDIFLEELVVRRELAHNFVYHYRDVYDKFECLPDWAKKTMNAHRHDKREHIYSYAELEEGCTHDAYWNAAQFELVHTHKMLGYLRMYWAKKVIEWSFNYESACTFLIEQNDKYALDGRDPCGYSGIMWNFGMHDRAHAERPVLGKIRYMCAEGIKRKFRRHIDDYVKINYGRAGRGLEVSNLQQKRKNAVSSNQKVKRGRKRI